METDYDLQMDPIESAGLFEGDIANVNMEDLRRLREEKTATISAEPLVSQPSTSVSTIFMSGTRPGEFSTSLVTVTLGERVRREASLAPGL